eukprot:gene22287-biopygen23714
MSGRRRREYADTSILPKFALESKRSLGNPDSPLGFDQPTVRTRAKGGGADRFPIRTHTEGRVNTCSYLAYAQINALTTLTQQPSRAAQGGTLFAIGISSHQLGPSNVGPGRVSSAVEGRYPVWRCGEWVRCRPVVNPGDTAQCFRHATVPRQPTCPRQAGRCAGVPSEVCGRCRRIRGGPGALQHVVGSLLTPFRPTSCWNGPGPP